MPNQPDPNEFPNLPPDAEGEDDSLTERHEAFPEATPHPESTDALRATDDPAYEEAMREEAAPEWEEAEADDDDVPFKLPRVDESDAQPTFRHNRDDLTMPHFREPGVPDPRETLPGTGGLDPNPEMQDYDKVPSASSEATMRHMPRVPDSAQPAPFDGGLTAANPNLADSRYQRPPQQQAVRQAQGSYMPPPPRSKPDSQPQRPLPRRRHRRILGVRPGCFYVMLGLFLSFCGGFTFLSLGAAAFFIPRIEAEWSEQIDRVDAYRAFESTFYYDRYGNQLYEAFDEGRRDTVPYERFPEDLINATVSIEDDSFWSNIGIDIGATTVAFLQFVGAGPEGDTPGGSTVTQQAVRNILFDFEYRAERSVTRKAEEIILAIALTARRSKEDIMELYLNEIYYGNLAYGAQAAAQTFFGKDVQDLTLGEAALLAGLPQAPADLDPLNPDPVVQDRVYNRWRDVLNEMVEEGYITAEERDTALRQGLNFVVPEDNNLRVPHFTVYAQNEFADIMNELGFSPDEITRGGYRVYTTVDQEIYTLALGAARTQVTSLQANNVSNAAVIVLQPITGQIIAMVGSVDYFNDAIDGRVNVTIALRQPGSTMKPFTYATALELGMTAGDVIWDTPTEIAIPGQEIYRPRNYDGAFHGPMTMRTALANSYNIPAVQTTRLIGVDTLLATMNRVGVSTLGLDASQYGLSLTLGGGEVSLLELSNAYGVLANQGAYVEPTSILCIVDSDNNIVYQYENGCPQGAGNFTAQTVDRRGFGTQVMDPRVAYLITDILGDNAARTPAMGSRSPLYTPNIASSVKTGTTNDVKDNWTIGYTRNVVVGVWVGNNDGDPMRNSSGLTGAAPIWNSVLSSIYSSQSSLNVFRVDGQLLPDQPNAPGGMSLRSICNVRTITDPTENCSQISEWFLDSPAGVPDGSGNLVYPGGRLADTQQQNSATLQEVSPDIYRALVVPLDPGTAAAVQQQFQLQAGERRPPAPRYCRVTPELVNSVQGAQSLLFIAGPVTSHNDAVAAEEYAQANGYAFLPTINCWEGVAPGGGNTVVTAVITSPGNGQTVGNPVTITGTVQFDSSQAQFWHLDVIGGSFADWTPMGSAGYSSVTDGTLWEGYLESGSYRVRLRLVGTDGGWLQTPYEVSFNVP